MKLNKQTWILFPGIIFFASACTKDINTNVNALNSTEITADAPSMQKFNVTNFLFVSKIDNPYFPLVPGTTFTYLNILHDDGEIGYEHETMTVTPDIKKIIGVNCEVVHDQVKTGGIVTEDTYDWYAQDKFGNVWYFGEDTKERTDNGGWSTEGSWEAGKQGALPGIIMFAHPGFFLGLTYYEEFQPGVAEDQATLLNINSKATVPYGSFDNCLETRNFTRLDPTDVEYKRYAPGVGQVSGRLKTENDELISIVHQ
jgi:hypothetical protein